MRSYLKKIIAREGLILIGLAVILYFTMLLCRLAPIVLPKYRVQFSDGKSCVITVHPDINYRNTLDRAGLLEEIHNPPPKLISRRIEEFAAQARISSKPVSVRRANGAQLYVSRVYARAMSQPFIIKLFFIYILLGLARFTAWALRVLRPA